MSKPFKPFKQVAELEEIGIPDPPPIYQKVIDLLCYPGYTLAHYNGRTYKAFIHQDHYTRTYEIKLNVISAPDLKMNMTKAEYKELTNYLVKHRNFGSKPFASMFAGYAREDRTTENGFKYLKKTDDIIYNYEVGEVIKTILPPPIEDENHKLMLSVLRRLVPDEKEFQALLDYLSLYTAEDRKGLARPCLVLTGARGLGKSLIVDYILAGIYKGLSMPFPETNYNSFNSYEDNRLVIWDEATHGKAIDMYNIFKRASGSMEIAINSKNQDAKRIISRAYFVVMSNNKPFHITDPINKNDKDIQFLVLDFQEFREDGTSQKEVIEQIKKELNYANIGEFFTKNLGSFVEHVLKPNYRKLKRATKKEHRRYGMTVPYTSGLDKLISESVTEHTEIAEYILTDIVNGNYSVYSCFEEYKPGYNMRLDLIKDNILRLPPINILRPCCDDMKADYKRVIKAITSNQTKFKYLRRKAVKFDKKAILCLLLEVG